MKTSTRLPLVLAAAAVVVAAPAASAVAGSGPSAHTASTHVVKLQNIAIKPAKLVIHAGDKVTWKFLDAGIMAEHTVTSKAGGARFKSTGAHISGAYSVTFKKKGTYKYECTIHPNMQGSIVVR